MPLGIASAFKFLGIGGTVAIGLAVALGITIWRADVISGQKDREREGRIACEQRHEITAASLEASLARNAAMIEAGNNAREASRKAVEAQKAQSRTLQAQIDRLRSTRPVAVAGECQSPESVLEAEGL